MLFAEAEGHNHVHFHVVPRMAWFGPDERGPEPEVFRFLNVVESEQVTLAVRDSLASQIGDVMRDALASDAPR